jgi:hypothetical protein
MKKFFAIILTICLMTTVLSVGALPVSAGGYSFSVCGLGNDGCLWGLGVYDRFEDAWNESVYYSTHLDEAWNSSIRFESESDRPEVEGFSRIVVEIYDDLKADNNGSFGSGIGFKDGAIYAPADSKITLDLCGHTVNRGLAGNEASNKAVYIDAGADVTIRNGTVIGGIHVDQKAKASIKNVYVTDSDAKNDSASAYSASIFGDGSLTTILLILTLVSSCVSIFLTVHYNKKKQAPAAGKQTETEDE